jgi:hypothetical protein
MFGRKASSTVVLAAACWVLGAVGVAQADFGITAFSGAYSDGAGQPLTQAGGHPDFSTHIAFPDAADANGAPFADEAVKDVTVDVPAGFVGNAAAVPHCRQEDLASREGGLANCPLDSQVGYVLVEGNEAQVYNMTPPGDAPAEFAFNVDGFVVRIDAHLRPGDNGVSAVVRRASQAIWVHTVDLTLWGVPADASHDARRFDYVHNVSHAPYDGSPVAFLRNPTSCGATPLVTTITANSWLAPETSVTASFDHDTDGNPVLTDGCDLLPFKPSVAVSPGTPQADSPTSLDVDLQVPQVDDPAGLSTADVRRVAVTLPEGMSVSPSSAAGLGACSAAQIGLASDAPPTCPDSSKIGSVQIDTPLLAAPLTGSVILAAQGDNPFGTLLAIYLVAQGSGVTIKLPGRVDADPVTGRLVATFDNTPQLPFSELKVHFSGGVNASLATPRACGDYTTHVEITSWASTAPVELDSPMSITQGCAPRGFAPAFTAGSDNASAGRDAPFSLAFSRTDGSQELTAITASLPAGLLARVSSVPLCPDAAATAGSCAPGSQIGETVATSGPGAAPLSLTGQVYLTGPYKGAPYGLSIVVPTAGQAGPFDLGDVVVRAGIYIDRTTAAVTVKSDPLPIILQGIPLRLRRVNVTIDRPNFMRNPTNCTPSQILGHITSAGVDEAGNPVVGVVNDQGAAFSQNEGAVVDLSVPFRVGRCRDLDYTPKLALALTGRGQTTDDKHPALTATLTQSEVNQANTKSVKVALPLSMALDPDNANELCEPTDAAADRCPAKSIVGHVSAISPILDQPLTGPVYFVRGERTDAAGKVHKTLPKLYVPLTGENGIKVDLHASSEVDNDRLVTTFDQVPDAPVTNFKLVIDGGKHGILVVSGANLCTSNQVADADLNGQNGAEIPDAAVTMSTPCTLGVSKTSHSSKTLNVTVSGLGAGKVAVSGKGLTKKSKTISDATVATVAAPISKSMRSSLAHGHNVKVKVKVSFTPKGAKKAKTATKTITIHGAKKAKKK